MSDKTDKQDSCDEIQTISHKFRSVTTIEPIFNSSEQIKTLKMNNSGSPCPVLDTKTVSTEDHTTQRKLPELNLPEKILFIIDTVREKDCTPFKLRSGAKYMPLYMIKRVVENFVSAKSTIQRSHEYALMILNSEGFQWICDFTNNTKTIVNQLDIIVEEIPDDEPKSYDFGQALETAQARLPLPTVSQTGGPAQFVSRIILIYARSNCTPKFKAAQKYLETLLENPYFFLDVLFVHEIPCAENTCEEVYSEITALDTTGFSYILEVGRNAAKLHDSMAKLLAHPLQRPPQKDACYTVNNSPALQEVHTNV